MHLGLMCYVYVGILSVGTNYLTWKIKFIHERLCTPLNFLAVLCWVFG